MRLLLLSLIALALPGLTQCAFQPSDRSAVARSASVPYRVKVECLAELRRTIPDRSMSVVGAVRNGATYIVEIRVHGVPNLWRCYHDGDRCTGTEYQGEG